MKYSTSHFNPETLELSLRPPVLMESYVSMTRDETLNVSFFPNVSASAIHLKGYGCKFQ